MLFLHGGEQGGQACFGRKLVVKQFEPGIPVVDRRRRPTAEALRAGLLGMGARKGAGGALAAGNHGSAAGKGFGNLRGKTHSGFQCIEARV